MIRRPPRSTRTDTLFPYPTLFRSDGGGAAGIARLLPTHRLAQGVVGALGWIGADIEVETEPRLHHGVDVERAKLAAQLHDVKRRDVDREVHAKTLPLAVGQQRRQRSEERREGKECVSTGRDRWSPSK